MIENLVDFSVTSIFVFTHTAVRSKDEDPKANVKTKHEGLIIKQFISQIRMPIQYIQYVRQSEYYPEKCLAKTKVDGLPDCMESEQS